MFSNRSGIPKDIRTRIESHDRSLFQGMAKNEFKKFTPDIIAAVGVSGISHFHSIYCLNHFKVLFKLRAAVKIVG